MFAKFEIERKRKEKLEERKKLEEEESRIQEKIEAKTQEKQEIVEKKRAIEKEIRQDRQLAVRILRDQRQVVVEDVAPSLVPNGHAKRDLSGWKYAEIRDTVYNSTDAALSDACREEFHRRLKVYNSWKERNAAKTVATEQRAPRQALQRSKHSAPISQSQEGTGVRKLTQINRDQRFFRIPFVRPCDQHVDRNLVKRGWWYAHFDGDYIARQMELHPDKPPLFLVAGKDDTKICELTLEQTGLTRKKGAEIVQKDFEQIWMGSGGREYLLRAISTGQARPSYAAAIFSNNSPYDVANDNKQ